MRWVDIDELEIPDGWQTLADTALNELQQEISLAEQTSRANGEDFKVARKKAISEGLNKDSRKKIWRDLAPQLAKLHNGKCWYSESLNSGSDKDIDHFRPKNRVAEDSNHEGYWWLAFEWRNYRYSCKWCNQRRVSSTQGGKWDHFPVLGTFRAKKESDDLQIEDIDLLDPVDPDDCKLLTFRIDGQPIPVYPIGTREHKRAEISIQIYHLNCREFVRDRKSLATKIRLLVENMEICYSKITDPTMKKLYKNHQKDLFRFVNRNSEYSAAALAYAWAEVYKNDYGHQVERSWLKEVLNSNP